MRGCWWDIILELGQAWIAWYCFRAVLFRGSELACVTCGEELQQEAGAGREIVRVVGSGVTSITISVATPQSATMLRVAIARLSVADMLYEATNASRRRRLWLSENATVAWLCTETPERDVFCVTVTEHREGRVRGVII
jgi:hypothetical protein